MFVNIPFIGECMHVVR